MRGRENSDAEWGGGGGGGLLRLAFFSFSLKECLERLGWYWEGVEACCVV